MASLQQSFHKLSDSFQQRGFFANKFGAFPQHGFSVVNVAQCHMLLLNKNFYPHSRLLWNQGAPNFEIISCILYSANQFWGFPEHGISATNVPRIARISSTGFLCCQICNGLHDKYQQHICLTTLKSCNMYVTNTHKDEPPSSKHAKEFPNEKPQHVLHPNLLSSKPRKCSTSQQA